MVGGIDWWIIELGPWIRALQEMAVRTAYVRSYGLAGFVRGYREFNLRFVEPGLHASHLDCTRRGRRGVSDHLRFDHRVHGLHLHPESRACRQSFDLRVCKSGSRSFPRMAGLAREDRRL